MINRNFLIFDQFRSKFLKLKSNHIFLQKIAKQTCFEANISYLCKHECSNKNVHAVMSRRSKGLLFHKIP